MAHKELKYGSNARLALEAGVDAVANAVKVTLGPWLPCRHRQEVRRPRSPMTVPPSREIEVETS